jgi:hypothetical protein
LVLLGFCAGGRCGRPVLVMIVIARGDIFWPLFVAWEVPLTQMAAPPG